MSATGTISPIERLQEDVEHYLLSEEIFKQVTITRMRPRDKDEAAGIQSKLDRVLAGLESRGGRAGLAIIILMPELNTAQENLPGVTARAMINIDVIENMLINRAAAGWMSAETCAMEVAGRLGLHGFAGNRRLYQSSQLMTPLTELVLDKKIGYRVGMMSHISASAPVRCVRPSVVVSENTMVFSTATEGAGIWWTFDGSYPGPGNPAALVYEEPISLPLAGEGPWHVRAAAWDEMGEVSGSEELSAWLGAPEEE